MTILNSIKTISYGIPIVGMLILTIAALFQLNWLDRTLSPYLVPVFGWTSLCCIFILTPTAIIRKTREFSFIGFMIAVKIFGTLLFLTSLFLTFEIWGAIGVVIGVLFAGFGIVPLALAATCFNSHWSEFQLLLVFITATVMSGLIAAWLNTKLSVNR